MASVKDVAAYILQKHGPMTTMKLQKLCYYSQGWSLAWDGEPIFRERIEAWANGPVVYDLFDAHRGMFRLSEGDIAGDPEALTRDQQETVDAVLVTYGPWTAQQLSDKSHLEPPWLVAREGLSAGDRARVTISLDVMQEYFGGLAAPSAPF